MVAFYPEAAWQVAEDTNVYDLHVTHKEWKTAGSRLRGTKQRASNKRKNRAFLFVVLAIVSLIAICLHTVHVGTLFADAGRRLAGRPPKHEGVEKSAVLEMCLDSRGRRPAHSCVGTTTKSSESYSFDTRISCWALAGHGVTPGR